MKGLELRKAGATWQQIADRLGYYDRGAARTAVLALIKEQDKEKVEDLRTLEGERLDQLQMAVWRNAVSGDERAIEKILAIMSHRAKLYGLFAPQKIAHTDAEGEDKTNEGLDEKLVDKLSRILKDAAATAPPTPKDTPVTPPE